MFSFNHTRIKQTERGLMYRNGDFEAVLAPGDHQFPSLFDTIKFTLLPRSEQKLDEALSNFLFIQPNHSAHAELVRAELKDTEVGLVYVNEVLVEILPPNARRLFWKEPLAVRVEVMDFKTSLAIPKDLLRVIEQALMQGKTIPGSNGVHTTMIPAFALGIMSINGQTAEVLTPGHYGFWRWGQQFVIDIIDTRYQALEVSGQEILTNDKVGLRLNVGLSWKFSDVLHAHAATAKPADLLYREVQFVLRSAVGTQSLDALLENKAALDERVLADVKARVMAFGIEVSSLGIKDIILPGEMKTILAQVVEAEKVAQANLIRRREETSATRALLNTAKVMEDNPVALRLKELETLERLAERIDKISVYGGLDGVLNVLSKPA